MMNPFASLFERRDSIENPSVPLSSALISEWDRLTSAGVTLSDEQAARVPDVFACIQVYSQDLGRCPLKLRRVTEDGGHEDAIEHPLFEILGDLTNPEMTAYEFRSGMQKNLLTYSRAYAQIVRNGRGEVVSLWPLDPRYMTVTRNPLNQKVWTYRAPNQREIVWTFHPSTPDVLELRHPSPIQECRDLIGLAYALDQFGAKFFANGARPSGTLNLPPGSVVSDEQVDKMREAFKAMYGGSDNAGKVIVTRAGATFSPITIPNNEAQYNETRQFIRSLLAGVFRIAPHKIGDLERATFANIEQLSIDHVQSMDPFFTCWEQTFRRDLLTTRQFPGYVAQFDRQALVKADMKSLLEALVLGRQNGVWNADDLRKKLGENPIGGTAGTAYLVNGNMTTADRAVTPPAPPPAPDPTVTPQEQP